MEGFVRSRDARGAGPPEHDTVPRAADYRDLAMQFESLGGSGHGPEFAIFQQHFGADPTGLLAWADLGPDLLIGALECRFEGVGLDANTIVFAPDHSDEWWTKDKRFWMAMRSFIKTDGVDLDQAAPEACHRLQSLRQKLVADLEAGKKIFVFKDLHRNLTEAELDRLHAAVRTYGDTTLLYVRYADDPIRTEPCRRQSRACWLAISIILPSRLITSRSDQRMSPGLHSAHARPGCTGSNRAGPPSARTTPVARTTNGRLRAEAARESPARPSDRPDWQLSDAGHGGAWTSDSSPAAPVTSCEHVPSYQDLSDEHRTAIQQADVVVEQLFDQKQQADTEALSTTTPRIFIPMVTAAFLWPFAGSPHPKNTDYPFLTGGPYGGEASDSYLNRLILAGTEPEEAVETYANLDVNSRVKLDRLFEIVMDRQRSRDETAGYQIADIMEQHFRTEQIFLSPYHPNVRIATALASQFFEQLGAERDEIDRMRDCTRITPFPKSELPFHPSVCRHFGLDFVTPDRRYRFMNEGRSPSANTPCATCATNGTMRWKKGCISPTPENWTRRANA